MQLSFVLSIRNRRRWSGKCRPPSTTDGCNAVIHWQFSVQFSDITSSRQPQPLLEGATVIGITVLFDRHQCLLGDRSARGTVWRWVVGIHAVCKDQQSAERTEDTRQAHSEGDMHRMFSDHDETRIQRVR